MPTLSKEVEKTFNKLLPCIQEGCSNDGVVPEKDWDGDWQPAQCEYCYKIRFPLKDFIAQIEQSAIQAERRRIIELCKRSMIKLPPTRPHNTPEDSYYNLGILKIRSRLEAITESTE